MAPQVALFVPCFVDSFFPSAAKATLTLLEAAGFSVVFPPSQTCCGQPQYNAGLRNHAARLARRFCDLFAPYDLIVAPSGSCVTMVRHHYPDLIGPHPITDRVFELSEFLVTRAHHVDFHARFPARAVVHIGCHARRQLGIAPHVFELLSHVRDLEIVPLSSDAWCCGFGGTFSVKFPEVSVAMARRKLTPAIDADLDYIISTDPSCSMHMQGVLRRLGRDRPRIVYLAEVLATGIAS